MKHCITFSVGAVLVFLAPAKSAGVAFDYKQNGRDWKNDYPDCGLSNQSPIDLTTGANDYKRYSSNEDQFTKSYSNQKGEVEVKWKDDMCTYVALEDGPNVFTSNIASSVFGATKSFSGVQFHFHAGSEHTVDGKRHDLEMHTVHTPSSGVALNGFDYAAVGIMFSVNDYTAKLTAAE